MAEIAKSLDDYEKLCTPSYWSKKHANREEVINHFIKFATKNNEETLKLTTNELNVPYGPTERQKIDYFYVDGNKSKAGPVFVYIHGGYWQEGDRNFYSFVVSPFVKQGFNCAVLGYDLCPSVKVADIVDEVQRGVEAIYEHFGKSPLVVCGHSAGAYLSAAVAVKGGNMLQDVVLVSGVYDVLPLLHTSLNDPLKMTEDEARNLNSLLEGYCGGGVRTHIFVGADESPWFVEQSRMLHEKVVPKEVCSFEVVPDEDHFSIIETLFTTESVLSSHIAALLSEKCKK